MTDQNIWVCSDCYFAHHYGYHEHDGRWYAGESDSPADRQPLNRCDGLHLFDNTCSNHESYPIVYDDETGEPIIDGGDEWTECEHCGQADPDNGIVDFSMTRCEGCDSTLGGSRHRLHYKEAR